MTKTRIAIYEQTHIEERDGRLFVYIPLSHKIDRKQHCPFEEFQKVKMTLECVGDDEQ